MASSTAVIPGYSTYSTDNPDDFQMTTASFNSSDSSISVIGVVIGALFGLIFVLTCVISAIKAVRDRNRGLARIEAKRQKQSKQSKGFDVEGVGSSENLVNDQQLSGKPHSNTTWPSVNSMQTSHQDAEVTVHNDCEQDCDHNSGATKHADKIPGDLRKSPNEFSNGHVPHQNGKLSVPEITCDESLEVITMIPNDTALTKNEQSHVANGHILQNCQDVSDDKESVATHTALSNDSDSSQCHTNNASAVVSSADKLIDIDNEKISGGQAEPGQVNPGHFAVSEEANDLSLPSQDKLDESSCREDTEANRDRCDSNVMNEKTVIKCSLHQIETGGVDNLSFAQ